MVGIFWILFLFYDIRRYNKDLNKIINKNHENDVSNDLNDIVRNRFKPGFYTKINVKTGAEIDNLDSSIITDHPVFDDPKDGIY